MIGHGPNLGHGWVKYVVIDQEGNELEPVIYPAQLARAQRKVAGALDHLSAVEFGGDYWWVGEDAAHAQPLTMLGQERLHHPSFVEDQDVGINCQGPSNGRTLALSAGQGMRTV